MRQYGFDETTQDCIATLSQWCLIESQDGVPRVVTAEAGGVSVGGTAEEVVAHIEKTWR